MYIYQNKDWPAFQWQSGELTTLLAEVRHRQGRVLGRMEGLGFELQAEAHLQTLTLDVLKSSEIEGEQLDRDQVRSSIARRLGLDIAGLVHADRDVEGIVEMMLDATQQYCEPLTRERLFSWHAALFPTGRSGMNPIVVGNWRNNATDDPMQVVGGPLGRETVHFRAPDAAVLEQEMGQFLEWFEREKSFDPLFKAAIAHLWFVTIHPFEDGNGRIARAIADLQMARADNSARRFYSMSMQIRAERRDYYNILEQTQKGDLDITAWLMWFLNCLNRALLATDELLGKVMQKARFWQRFEPLSFNGRQKMMVNRLMDGFEGKLTSSKWAKIAKCSQDTASRDINQLVDWGVLRKSDSGGRSTSYGLRVEAG